MNKIKYMTALCAITVCLSCQNANNEIDMDFNDIDIDLPEKPDKVIENTPGILYYRNDFFKGWYVKNSIPGTHDSIENYLIAEIPDKKFCFEEGKQVSVSGFCYEIPRFILFDKGIIYPAGIEFYYIKVTNIK